MSQLSSSSSSTPVPAKSSSSLSGTQTPLERRKRFLLSLPESPCLKRLGFGTGVGVFLYERGGRHSPWAVKKTSSKTSSSSNMKASSSKTAKLRLDREAKLLCSLKHENIIGFRGYKRSSDGHRVLAIENGQKSLLDLVEARAEQCNQPFEVAKIVQVVLGLAKALHYLHTEAKVLHGDIKAANVLVINDFETIKLCDFGVSLELNERLEVTGDQEYIGTAAYCAPETIVCDDPNETKNSQNKENQCGGVVTSKADIFALGCVIFEMIALFPPHNDKWRMDETEDESESSGTNSFADSFNNQSAYEEVLGTRPELPSDVTLGKEYNDILSVFYACTEADPEKRPSALTIIDVLDGKGKTEGDVSIANGQSGPRRSRRIRALKGN